MAYSKYCLLVHLILVLRTDWPLVTMQEAITTKALCAVRQTRWRKLLEPWKRAQWSLLVPSLILLNQTSIQCQEVCHTKARQVQSKLNSSLNLHFHGGTRVLMYFQARMTLCMSSSQLSIITMLCFPRVEEWLWRACVVTSTRASLTPSYMSAIQQQIHTIWMTVGKNVLNLYPSRMMLDLMT